MCDSGVRTKDIEGLKVSRERAEELVGNREEELQSKVDRILDNIRYINSKIDDISNILEELRTLVDSYIEV